jgi:hypothetical protein
MATINVPDATFRQLTEAAAAMHLPLDKFLDHVVGSTAALNGTKKPAQPGTPEWIMAFNEWIASHPARGIVADDSRDAIYGDERD